MRGQACPLQHTGGPSAHLRAGRPRSREHLRSGAFPGSAGSLPASTHRWACGPLAGGTPAIPGTPPLERLSRERGLLARFNSPVGLRPTCGRDARDPRNPSARCFPWERGHLARFNSPVGLRPTCGRDARDPGNTSARAPFPGARASCPLQLTGGPSAHLRAGRPRSQEPLRSVLSLGARAACPLQHTGGPAAHLRAGRPRSQGTTCLVGPRRGLAGDRSPSTPADGPSRPHPSRHGRRESDPSVPR